MSAVETKQGGKKGFGGLFVIIPIFIILVAVMLFFLQRESGKSTIEFEHLHGMAFTPNGDLYLPVHDGVAVYEKNGWKHLAGDKNDYMGFSMVDDGFYSSGHPGEGSKLANPLGLVKVTNSGKKISTLGLAGETDFHLMAASYYSHGIYVVNPEKNSKMNAPGLYYTLDDGKSWTKAQAKGLQGKVTAVAVDPKKKNVVAIGTGLGVFYSTDSGKTFKNIFPDENVTALSFGFGGELLAGTFAEKSKMLRIDPNNPGSNLTIELSSVEQDPISYIAQNPKDSKQLVVSTMKNDIFSTNNFGQNWTILAKGGKGLGGK
ncbi:Beta-barrel assembly machine subunit BamC [Scopulibacillus darangshiensis]|uniref:Beta-barrel assembly machine subunit BamC n=1 Tax=Scopulibacillus darangshiensis TaxID=442528 RepID=A0A4R2P2M5_9BACL|nr:glycosyl hydrolase [Scopulibacillus darangshiensis]TCP28940.1 Beta-barrel assembly machine subunit BamC [Scopulibacillus darangshiensis]